MRAKRSRSQSKSISAHDLCNGDRGTPRKLLFGRENERAAFRSALTDLATAPRVLYMYGLGGVGKTALLDVCLHEAARAGVLSASLDGRSIDASPREFLRALTEALRLDEAARPLEYLSRNAPIVLAIDSYDSLAPLAAWFQQTFFPQLPERALVLVAARGHPPVDWLTDPWLRPRLRLMPLGNLGSADSRALLSARQVPEEQHAAILQFTHGHPLALVLVADVGGTAGIRGIFRPEDTPQVLNELLRRLVVSAPTARHRRALETCAHARVTTEALLAAVIGESGVDVHEHFEWLRGLSFIEQRREGLLPHEVVREVLDADFRWRDPDGYLDLHRRLSRYLQQKLVITSGRARQRLFFDKLFLHRSAGASQYDHASLGTVYAQPATPADHAAIIEAVRVLEGAESARIAALWIERQPQSFEVARGSSDEVLGFVASLFLDNPSSPEAGIDPAIHAAWAFAHRVGRLREGEAIVHHRFHMSNSGYQEMSAITNVLAMCATFAPLEHSRLALSFLPFADPDRWHSMMQYVKFELAIDAAFSVDGRRYGVFVHDWRIEPFELWIDAMAERSSAAEPPAQPAVDPFPRPAADVLSRREFDASVRQALRDYVRPDALAGNRLRYSRVALDSHGQGSTPAALRAILEQALDVLRRHPRDEKFYRAVLHTYFQPAGTQESVAERLGLPFNTYRYHLARGIDRMSEWLWNVELGRVSSSRERNSRLGAD